MTTVIRTQRQTIVAPSGASGAVVRPGSIGSPGAKGDPGGNVMAIGLFTALSALTVPLGTDVVHTSGHAASGQGAARYVADASVTVLNVATYPKVFAVDAGGRGWRLDHNQDLEFYQFGAHSDNAVTDDHPTFEAAKAYFIWLATNGKIPYYDAFTGVYRPFPALRFKIGHYRTSLPMEFDGGAWDVTCEKVFAQNGGYGAAFKVDPGNDGVVLQNWNTTGVNTAKTSRADSYGAQGSRIRNMLVYTTGAGSNATACGFYVRTKTILENCQARDFPLHGACVAATAGAGGAAEGNANGTRIIGGQYVQNGGSGVQFIGADVNASAIEGVTLSGNALWGIDDSAFLDIHPRDCLMQSNGMTGSGPSWGTSARGALCSDGTYRYYVISDQQVAASTTAPTSGTSNAAWGLFSAGASDGYFYPTWTTGLAWKSGGACRITQATSQTVFRDCYGESDNAPAQLGRGRWDGGQAACKVIGALIQNVNAGTQLTGGSWMVAGSDGKMTVAMGRNIDPTVALSITHTDYDTSWGPWQLGYNTFYHDLLLYRQAAPSLSPYRITTDQTIFNPGRSATVPNRMVMPEVFLGADNAARSITYAAAAPTTGAHGTGDIVFNNAPAAGGKVGWVCVTAGTPGTWKAFGVIDA